jgi:hypothetical protein
VATTQGSLIQTSLPTAMTRNQNRQLAGGTTLTFPKCKVYYDGVGVTGRQCILSISAESLVIEIHTREEVIATLPLSCVKELAVRTDDLPSPHFPRDQSLTARPPPGLSSSTMLRTTRSTWSCVLSSQSPVRR